jgi:formylmethanofuran dehydrogenase subunit B
MAGTKELTELLRAYAVVQAKVVAYSADGEFSRWDGVRLLASSMMEIWDGIAGAGLVLQELKDLDGVELDGIIDEVSDILAKSKKFTHRQRDIAERILRMVYREIREVSEMIHLPPTAELVQEPNLL